MRQFLRDFGYFLFLEGAIQVVLIAGGLVVLHLSNIPFSTITFDGIIIVLAVVALVVGTFLARRVVKPKTRGVQFYAFRQELPDLETFFARVKDKGEIYILGIELDNLALHKADSIRHALERGVRFKIVGLNPDASNLVRFLEKTFTVTKTKERTEAAREIFCELGRRHVGVSSFGNTPRLRLSTV